MSDTDSATSVTAPPAPWEVVETDDGHDILMATALTARARHSYEPQHVINYDHGLSPDDGDGRQWDEAEAIAAIVGAAPDLLAAAKFALSVLKANPVEMSERMAIEKLEAAIEKAEGRTNG